MALVGTVSADNPLSFKNLIINGDMRIAQRGTSFTATGYTVDRFGLNEDTDGGITVTQSTEAPTNFKYSLKVDVTTADTSLSSTQNAHFYQNIEGLNLQHLFFGSANAQTVTLSFWVRSNKTGTYSIVLENSAANRCYVSDYSISSANTWEQKSITIDGDTSGTWLITNGVGLRVRFGLASGTTYTTSSTNQWIASDMVGSTNMVNLLDSTDNEWYLTGVQLEVGSVATPFERRPYGLEFSLCQRYYQIFYPTEQELIYIESNAATQKWWSFTIPEPMRTTPSVTASAGMTGGTVAGLVGVTISSLTLEGSSLNRISFRVNMSGTGGTAYNIAHTDGFSGDSVALSAEL